MATLPAEITGDLGSAGGASAPSTPSALVKLLRAERRQWWLWASAIFVTLVLTAGMLSFAFPSAFFLQDSFISTHMRLWVCALAGLVLLFDVYSFYQQLEMVQIRRRLIQNERLFHLIGEHAADLIAVVDAHGKLLYTSPAYERVLGYSSVELDGTSSLDQVFPDDRDLLVAASEEALRNGSSPRVEYRIRHKSGHWLYMESTASAVSDDKHGPGKLVVVNRDITQRKQAAEELRQREEQLRQGQKMEAIGRLSGGIAHDFNNLLSVIIGYSELLELRLTASNPLMKNAQEIKNAAQRAAGLTRQLLAFSRQQVLQPRILDLNTVVNDTSKMLRRLIGEDIELITCFGKVAKIKADQSQIEQIIMNLAVNARDAMPTGGKLVIETADVTVDAESSTAEFYMTPGRYTRLTVADSGVGMDDDTRGRIFEPFFTTKEKGKGTGLGLATVYGVVKQSGGYIFVDSKIAVGTTFSIYLPPCAEATIPEFSEDLKVPETRGSGCILFAEDLDPLRALAQEVLSRNGYTVLAAPNGAEALALARKHKGVIDLLVTDIVMPEMGGIELSKQFLIERPDTPVIFATGYSEYHSAADTQFARSAGMLAKPYTPEMLIWQVKKALDAAKAVLSSAKS